MEKPIIATTLAGLFINHKPWDEAHEIWFKERAKELDDDSILAWIGKEDYFKGVDEVMIRLYPNISEDERTKKARELFFESVLKYIEQNPGVKHREIIDYFVSLKDKYRIALITTNTIDATQKIISIVGLGDLFDMIETSLLEEKDDKEAVFNKFIEKHGKPILYIGGGRRDSYDYCQKYGIKRIFANLEGDEELEGVPSIHNLEELKAEIV